MAHSRDTAEAVDASVEHLDLDSAAAAIGRLGLDEDEPAPEDEEIDADEPEPEGEGEDDEDQDDGGDEPETAIDAPASLNAEEKARFAQLPEEAQRVIADVEARRAEQVQTATTKAAEAQRIAEANAARADAQAKAVYAQQLKVFSDQLAPQRPDAALATTDPSTYIALNAQFDASKAQYDDFVQQVQALAGEAQTQIDQAEVAERDRFLMTLPEVQSEDTRNGFFSKAIAAASVLGLDATALNRATGPEWKALRQVSEWKEEADKYRSASARQMQRVRDAKKTKSAKPNAVRESGRTRGYSDARQRLKDSGSLDDAAAAITRLG